MRLGWRVAVVVSAALLVGQASAQTKIAGTSGPYAAVMTMDPSLPDHTVYRPADLSRVTQKLPVVSFGNGGCSNVASLRVTLRPMNPTCRHCSEPEWSVKRRNWHAAP